jgi:hypothetical protein
MFDYLGGDAEMPAELMESQLATALGLLHAALLTMRAWNCLLGPAVYLLWKPRLSDSTWVVW